jgi:hypothetical protein
MMMKRKDYLKLAVLLAATGSVLTFGLAHAEDGPPNNDRPSHRFKEADTNNDGFITKDEMRAAAEKRTNAMFEKLDTNKDSKLSEEELKAGRKMMREKFRERWDKKHDGPEEHDKP